MANSAQEKNQDHDHDAIDGCLCDVKHDVPPTADHELPPPRPKPAEQEKRS